MDDIDKIVEAQRRSRFLTSPQLSLGKLIGALRAIEIAPGKHPKVYYDFGNFYPTTLDSWRGSYSEISLGFGNKPEGSPEIRELIKLLEEGIGNTYTGYKGGEFTMDAETPIWADDYGTSSETAIVGVIDDGYRAIIETRFIDY